ncbi:MAG TPA: TldD/PmbA family protein [Acidimicrobiales bacterium]|nr:TldD/PmbA family protein [Acidimicrobiales bacterium]
MGRPELEICDRILETVGDRAEATVRVTSSRDGLTRFANSFIHQNMAEDVTSVTLTAVIEGRLATSSSTDTTAGGTSRLAEATLAAARLRPPDPHWPGLAPPAESPAVDHWDEATYSASPAERAGVVRAFVDAGPGLDAAGICSTDAFVVGWANSAGLRLSGRATVAQVDAVARTATSDGLGAEVSRALADLDGGRAGVTAAEKARASAEPVELRPGTYEVVLEPACLASILDFLARAGFNGKAHAEGQSFAHLGEAQFDSSVSIWSDAYDPRAIGLAFDGEGTPRHRLDLVRDGLTVALAHDRRSAGQAGTQSTGHFSGDHSAGPMPTNLFFGPGDQSVDDLVGGVERGLLVSDFWYIRFLDPKTQVVTGLTRNGLFLIEGGHVTRAVRNLRFTQSFAAALGPGRVLGIGNDACLATGDLGALYGWFHHVPTLRLAAWNFTGGASG